MANVIVGLDQGITIQEMPSPTTVRGVIGAAVRSYETPNIGGPLIDIILTIPVTKKQWTDAVVAYIDDWALANGHTVIQIIFPDFEKA